MSKTVGGTSMTKNYREPSIFFSMTDEAEFTRLMEKSQANDSPLAALLSDVWKRSYESREHGERMAALAWEIGKRMNLTQNQLQDLILLALFHDLGKIDIPEYILRKAGSLSEDEWTVMKSHSELGSQIAKTQPGIKQIADEILHHHERWDGKGYPGGLLGHTIPALSRVIFVVDSFDTMTHSRVYRVAMDSRKALNEIVIGSRRQSDPDIVDVLMGILKTTW